MKHRTIFAMITALLLAGTINLTAQHRGERGEMMMKELNLSEEQAGKMKELRSEQMKSMADHQAEVKKARIDLRGLMTSDSPDRSAIKAKMKEIADLRLKEGGARVDHMFAVREILTPEQQKLMKGRMGMRMQGRGERGAMRHRRPGMRGEGMHEGRGMQEKERMHR